MILSSLVEIVIGVGLIFIGDFDIKEILLYLSAWWAILLSKGLKLYRGTCIRAYTNARFVLNARQMQGRFVEVNRGSDG